MQPTARRIRKDSAGGLRTDATRTDWFNVQARSLKAVRVHLEPVGRQPGRLKPPDFSRPLSLLPVARRCPSQFEDDGVVILAEVAPDFQPSCGGETGGLRDLVAAEFDEQHTARSQPVERLRDEPSNEVEPVRAAEESSARFEVESFARQEVDGCDGRIGWDGRDDGNAAAQLVRQSVQTVEDMPFHGGTGIPCPCRGIHVRHSAPHSSFVRITEVDDRIRHQGGHDGGDGTNSAEGFEHNGLWDRLRSWSGATPPVVGQLPDGGHCAFGQQSCPLPWHKHSGLDTQSQTGEVDPSDDLLEGLTGYTASHQPIESQRGAGDGSCGAIDDRCGASEVSCDRRLKEDHCFVFGEDAARRAQRVHGLREAPISPSVDVVSRVEAPGLPGFRRQRGPRCGTS